MLQIKNNIKQTMSKHVHVPSNTANNKHYIQWLTVEIKNNEKKEHNIKTFQNN